jgi:hypothetical protein
MTVNEPLQKLVELAQSGRGTWEVKHFMCCHCSSCSQEIEDVLCEDETKEVVIE